MIREASVMPTPFTQRSTREFWGEGGQQSEELFHVQFLCLSTWGSPLLELVFDTSNMISGTWKERMRPQCHGA